MRNRNYKTEAPFVVTAKAGGKILSVHYSSTGAIEAAKSSKTFRVIHGRHQGVWHELVHYEGGKKLWSKK